jgi:hypothetical protein
MSGETNREIMQRVLDERLAHDRRAVEEDPWCFALAELQPHPDWDGQFLAEFMRSASGRRPPAEVRIVIDDTPALMVATHGPPVSIDAILDGGGFSPVLAITDTPEVYAALGDHAGVLAVRFDAEVAREMIGSKLPSQTDFGDSLAALRALRYPIWVDELPASVQSLADQGYDTVLRLPFTSGDADEWFRNVLGSVRRVIEQEPLLVGGFARVTVEVDGYVELTSLHRHEVQESEGGLLCELAEVVTDGSPISAWWLYCLESAPDTVVGIRLELDDRRFVLLADDYYPPWVDSGVPFLLQTPTPLSMMGEQEVAALANLMVLAVGDCAASGEVDMAYLARLVVTDMDGLLCPVSPTLLKELRRGLNDLAWIPTASGGVAPPLSLLPADHETLQAMMDAFSFDHVVRKTGLQVPDLTMDDPVYDYARYCRPDPEGEFWDAVSALMGRDCRHLFGGSPEGLEELRATLRFMGMLARDLEEDGL